MAVVGVGADLFTDCWLAELYDGTAASLGDCRSGRVRHPVDNTVTLELISGTACSGTVFSS